MYHENPETYHPTPLLRGVQIFLLVLIVVGVGFLFTQKLWVPKLVDYILANEARVSQMATTGDYRDIEYLIDGRRVKLENGVSETETAPGSAARVVTRYFGNELVADLNDDGRNDVVFLLAQETGGSGIFYYAVAALNTEQGYIGSDGYFLGDRIAPQTTETSRKPRHKNVVVVNYADRALGEPMTVRPSVGKSAYIKLDVAAMQWGIVVPDFEGESR